MKKIGLIADTHNYLDGTILRHFESCDEIWHAGDFGSIKIAEELSQVSNNSKDSKCVLRGVFGNIDGSDVRTVYPEKLLFTCESVKIFMQHIGGYPGHYAPGVKQEIISHKPNLFISGHSHILKIIFDEKFQCLHMNPGAAGIQGWHKTRTIIRFVIDGAEIRNCEVIELGNRSGILESRNL
jgi:putative phosphoesterase